MSSSSRRSDRVLYLVSVSLPTDSITLQQPPSFEPPVPPGPDSVVSATNLSCTVANEGSFQWQWTLPPGITFIQMWFTDGTRTSIVQISQISAANAGDYTCTASFNGQSANSTTAVQLKSKCLRLPYTKGSWCGKGKSTSSIHMQLQVYMHYDNNAPDLHM